MIPILGGPIPIVAHTQTAMPTAAQAGVAAILPAQPVAPIMAAQASSQTDDATRRDSRQRGRERRQRDADEASPDGESALGRLVDTEI